MSGKLFLIPSFLSGESKDSLPPQVLLAANACDVLIVENLRTARRFLRAMGYTKNFDTEVQMHEMPKHESIHAQHLATVFEKIVAGGTGGLLSEAGNPCIADPGARYVAHAHAQQIQVVPLVGPSSILLSLIASGFNGQQFTFHGYLPLEQQARAKRIRELEAIAHSTGYTQIFMETPYRNMALLNEMLQQLKAQTCLCIACDLSLSTEFIQTKTIRQWQAAPPDLSKRPCMFLVGSVA